ncbi:hypothetical protein DL95DRAFT_311007, partial [Leptodontidium sp. 2 PMI_412]
GRRGEGYISTISDNPPQLNWIYPCFVAPQFVSNTELALRLVADKEKDRSYGFDLWKIPLETLP